MIHDSGFMKNKRGFTLVEVIVVIAITAILASYLIVYGSKSRSQVALSVEQAKLIQVLSRAKALAISTYANPQAPCGYGVHIDSTKNTYALFSYDVSTCGNIPSIDMTSQGYQEIETFPLSNRIVFETSGANVDTVFFLPPDPMTFLWEGSVQIGSGSGSIRMTASDGSLESSVSVSTAGQIGF